MKKQILLAGILLIATSCFCQSNKHLALEMSPTTTKAVAPKVVETFEEEHVEDLEPLKVINEDTPVYGVELMPQFPGGDKALLKFIKDNLRYPKIASQLRIEGRVIMRFIVNRNGNVTDVTVIRGIDPTCDKEAVRVLKMMPKWTPGRQNGRNVPVYYTIPIIFKLKK